MSSTPPDPLTTLRVYVLLNKYQAQSKSPHHHAHAHHIICLCVDVFYATSAARTQGQARQAQGDPNDGVLQRVRGAHERPDTLITIKLILFFDVRAERHREDARRDGRPGRRLHQRGKLGRNRLLLKRLVRDLPQRD